MNKTQTATGKKWVLRPEVPQDIIDKYPEMHPYLVQVLFNRGISDQEHIDEFINLDYGRDVHDPFLFKNMKKAVERIVLAIERQESITVYGDYDADGVTSSVILMEVLQELGAKPKVYIPYRKTEGYGLNKKAVKELNDNGTNLIITVDCGTTNTEEVAMANDYGMEVIIVDHHQQPEVLPPAFTIINPALIDEPYPFRHLTSGGLAYKVAIALLLHTKYGKTLGLKQTLLEGSEKWWLDLVAISTVADMAPLNGENRALVHYGISVLKKTRRLGLQALYREMSVDPQQTDAFTIGFQLGPRLNAAGRLDHASAAYALLVSKDVTEAGKLAADLQETNQTRQSLTSQMVAAAKRQIGEAGKRRVLFAFDKDWQIGVVGLVAGKLANLYHLPVIVMGTSGLEIIGSGRSIPAYNIVEGLTAVSKYLLKFGGHPQACGFTLASDDQRLAFEDALQKHATQALKGIETVPPMEIDAQIELQKIDWPLVEALSKLEPHGQGNSKPQFVARGLEIVDMQTVGKDNKHLRMMVKQGTPDVHKTIGFTFGDWAQRVKIGDSLDLVFEISINEWNGNRETQLTVKDIKRV